METQIRSLVYYFGLLNLLYYYWKPNIGYHKDFVKRRYFWDARSPVTCYQQTKLSTKSWSFPTIETYKSSEDCSTCLVQCRRRRWTHPSLCGELCICFVWCNQPAVCSGVLVAPRFNLPLLVKATKHYVSSLYLILHPIL